MGQRVKRVGSHSSSYRASQTCAHYRDVHLDQDLHTIELPGRVCKRCILRVVGWYVTQTWQGIVAS